MSSRTLLEERLAGVPGLTLKPGEPLARHTTFKIGGPAELFVDVGTEAALSALLAAVREAGCPFLLIGLGSNLLVADEGLPGVVARLSGDFRRIQLHGTRALAGAAVALPHLAKAAAKAGLSGLEPLCGFPSTVGGAVWMNAGCYGREIKDVLISAWLVYGDGRRQRIGVRELGAGYRSTALQATDALVTRASFRLQPADPAACLAQIEELNARRWASLPSGVGNAGSIFKNPPGDYAGRLIEACGLKGRTEGGAQISDKHANVIVNRGGARAGDVLALMREARRAVAERFGVTLQPEVVLAGAALTSDPPAPPSTRPRPSGPRTPARTCPGGSPERP
ncbi:MAG TPA: UDP-N-acetylmuramate dehydrogenase [Thermoanaerobaculia bacterium]|nr:UDP-N-acetylmuramate dehydrogenase [Thermoanaerobaculia bacterium]